MALILKQEANANVTTPPAGSGAVFLNTSDQLTVKDTAGNISTIPTFTPTGNTSVFFNDAGALGESANLSFVKTTNTLTVTNGNLVAGGVKTDNLYYANGQPWDLSDPGGSNTQIQFNDNESFGGSANFVWNNSTNTLSVTGTSNVTGSMNVTGNAGFGNVNAGNALTANFVAGTLTTAAQPNITSVGTLTTLTTSGNAVIGGNLTVNGNITYINVETFDVEDPIISVGGGPNGTPLTSNDGKDRGLLMHYYTVGGAVDAFMGWDNSNSEFAFGSNVTSVNDIETFNAYGNVRASTFIGNITGATANFSGNITAANANLGNVVTGNYFTGVLTYAAQPNITSLGTLQSLLIGATSSTGDYSNAKTISSQDNSGGTASDNVGLVGEAVASSANANITGIGLLGIARANSATKGTGVQGEAKVTNTADTGAAVGVRGYATDTHAGGYNIGVLGNAIGSGVGNYAFYVQNGGIASIENPTFWDLTDNSNAALTFSSTGKANIFGIETTDNSEGIFTTGYLNVSGNATVGGIKTNNYYYANGSPVDFQQAGGSNTQVQFNDADGFGGSAAFTFNKTTNAVSMGGTLAVTGNASAGNISTGGLISATGNVSGGNLTTAGAVVATGNVTGGNLTTGGVVSATGNVSGANITTAGVVTATGNVSGGNLTTGGALSVTGNANVGNLGTGGLIVATGNVTGGNLTTAGKVVASTLESNVATGTAPFVVASTTKVANLNADLLDGYSTDTAATANTVVIRDANGSFSANVITANLSGNATTAGTVTTAAQPNITSVGTLSSLAVTANVTAGNVYANSGTIGASLLTGTLTTAAQPNVTSVGTLSSLTVSGNASAGNLNTAGTVTASRLISNVATGTAPLTVTSTTRVANLNVDYANVADNINVTAPGTGTGYVVFANATTGNVAEWTSSGITSNLANNSITATTFVGALSGAATTAGTVTTAAQPNITSVGTLTSLGVNGTVTAVAFTANTGVFTGNGSGLSQLAGGNVTGQVGNALVAGTVYTAAQPNITSVGTLTSVAVTGNATAGNVYANSGTIGASLLTGTLTTAAQPNVTSVGTLSSLSVTGNVAAGNLTTTGVLSVTGTGVSSIGGNLDMTSNNIINLATPVNSTDAATKQYVDDVAQGLNIHDSVQAATPNTLAVITSGTITYDNGSNGVGATLTTTGTFNLIDGVNVQTAGTRILVKNEANAVFNGIYTYTNTTAITRAVDFNSIPEVEAGDFVFVTGGTLYDNTGWVQTESPTGIGTSGNNISFTQFSGAGTYQAGTGLTLTGSTFSVNASQTQITSVGTLTGLGVNGTITGVNITANTGVFTGNGSGLSAIAGGNVTGQVANALVAGTVYTAAQPNITSVGTLTSLSVTGNVSAGNVSGTLLTGTLTTAAQPNVTSLGTLTSLGVNGTVTAVAFTANTGVFTGNGSGLSAIAGANVTGTVSSATTAGTVTTAAQPNITSVGTLTSLAVTGNATAGNVYANSGTIGASLLTGTLTTAAQPNVTSVGTLSSLTVSGNASAGNLNTAGAVVASTLTSNVATGTAPLTVTSTTRVANLNVAYANVADNINVSTLSTGTQYLIFANAVSGNVAEGANTIYSANIANGSLAATTFVGAHSGDGSALSALNASNISSGTLAQARLANASLTVNGTSISLGGSGTITANTTQTLTLGTYLTGTSFNGGTAVTAAVDATTTNTASKVVARDASGNFAAGTITATLSGAATTAGTVTTAAQPNITSVGTLTSLSVSGALTNANLTTGANSTAGSITGNWTLTAGSRFNATYADLAERYVADAQYEPGTVLVFGGEHEVSISGEDTSHRVAGVVSTEPAYLMNSECQGEYVVDLALIGRVPVKVMGPIRKGDLIVTSENAGYGKANNEARAGTIIGKALEHMNELDGVIEVLIGRC